jgi:two-component system sensor histidine kinase AlgZ
MTTGISQEERQFLPNLCNAQAVLVVVVVAELMAIVLALMSTYYRPFSLSDLALSSFFMQWVGLSAASLLCGLRRHLNRLPMALAALAVVLLVALDTFVLSLVAQIVRNWLTGASLLSHLFNSDVLSSVLIAAILTGMTMRYFYVQEELMRRRESELKARIQALQSRIRPHFLFNSMNIIASLISIDPDAAEQVVDDLSQLFRASLRESSAQVTLAQELALCRHYVHIEQLRLGERLAVDWQVDETLLEQPLPLLTLQPLLENAIYHGIQPRPDGGCVRVEAVITDAVCRIRISNPLAPGVPARTDGNRIAINNIRARLHAIYGTSAYLTLETDSGEFVATLTCPLTRKQAGEA